MSAAAHRADRPHPTGHCSSQTIGLKQSEAATFSDTLDGHQHRDIPRRCPLAGLSMPIRLATTCCAPTDFLRSINGSSSLAMCGPIRPCAKSSRRTPNAPGVKGLALPLTAHDGERTSFTCCR